MSWARLLKRVFEIEFGAPAASQTTYALYDPPTEVLITYPPHPLFRQTLKVVGHRREGDETFWVVALADPSRLRVRSQWTNHPRGRTPVPTFRPGTRATAKRCESSPPYSNPLSEASTTRVQDKKRLIRCLMAQVVVCVPEEDAPRKADVHWVGG